MAEDILDVLDDDGNVVDQATYSDCHRLGLRHRAVEVALFRQLAGATELLVQRRSQEVKFFPGALDLFGGHVQTGESFEAAASREAEEESGLTGFFLVLLTQRSREVRTAERIDRENIHVFGVDCSANHSIPTPQPGEVASLCWRPLNGLQREYQINPIEFAPGLAQLLTELVQGCYTLR